ncbi:hypothetical protein SAMN05216571_101232 [Onishia taeanensis]|uniref:Uncharacterized protein n=1 Tax=Onishia taeanensis TaxID=284577 RepID=A0A1G7N5A3_9GAMM|nr:hypothetical protein [Halomonas taeanensis]SDF69116.1 hypothetical protein SAMN05216571_101232 [Halomonas taeanensis]
MSVILLPSAQPKHQRLTSAHRCLIARIQDLCIDVSQRTEFYAMSMYSGHVHTVSISLYSRESVERGDYTSTWRSGEIYLPPSKNAQPDSLRQLTAAAEHLEGLLPPAGGAA